MSLSSESMRRRHRPTLEPLETRLVLTSYVVTTAEEGGSGSLRQAILDANANPGPDTIGFRIGAGGLQTIRPTTELPVIADPVVIDGTTQPGYAGRPLIELNGGLIPGLGVHGLVITAGNSTIRGLIVNGIEGIAILLRGQGDNHIAGNYIGTNAAGDAAVLNRRSGVEIELGSGNLIGGTRAEDRNVISGTYYYGVRIASPKNRVQGNFVGTDATGTRAIPNLDGVNIGAPNNFVGGTAPGAGNVISGNRHGLLISGANNRAQGNFVGTDVTGTLSVRNEYGGIELGYAPGTVIGGTEPGAGNLVSGNEGPGIWINGGDVRVEGNFVGTDVTGTERLSNGGGIRSGPFVTETTLIGGPQPGAGNLISGNRGDGILLDRSQNVRIQGNLIGTDITGTRPLLGAQHNVYLYLADFNLIGGTGPGERNIISGAGDTGVFFWNAFFNRVQGNWIGTDVTGTRAVSNGFGVRFHHGDLGNVIGGTEPGARNVISGNRQAGVFAFGGPNPTSNHIQGNWIGLDATGTRPLPNEGHGVRITDLTVSGFHVGGTGPGEANVIAYNGGDGVRVEEARRNPIRGNYIFGNTGGGIRLMQNGNENQAAPVLTSAVNAVRLTTVRGTLSSRPSTTFMLEFFANRACHSSGFGEGERPEATLPVTTDNTGRATFALDVAWQLKPGMFVTATATDATNNTSAFSRCQEVTAGAVPGPGRSGLADVIDLLFEELHRREKPNTPSPTAEHDPRASGHR